MTIRPKHIAATDFVCNGHQFVAGDAVTDPVVIDAVAAFGDQFVTTDTARARKGSSAAADQAEAPTPNNTKEA